jgi:hypothetical protein
MANVRTKTLLIFALLASPAAASTAEPPAGSILFDTLLECRSVNDERKRLACYDGQAEAAAAAQKKGDVVILSKEELKDTRRSLFGFLLPKFSVRGLRMDEPDVDRIETTVTAARSVGYHWSITLADNGGTWETTEYLDVRPKSGDRAKIKKGLMGGYLGTIGSSNLIRMRRVL